MKPEILSPAGNMHALQNAVRAGADAVYLGLKNFSARNMADNFDGDALCVAVKYCHARKVAVYLALNTLINDNELPEMQQSIITAINCGVDAIIVQDLGIMQLIKEICPTIPLHASTQLSVHNLEGALAAQSLGFSRVVLARELSINEIEYISKNCTIELEVFVHGALCMSVSGQCYFSAALGGRSANRGTCAQTCRLPFKALGGTGYDLSLKDNNWTYYINKLILLNVASLKIEGRQKSPEYVALTTKVYRNAVDGITTDELLISNMEQVFSRSGFTSGYASGNLGKHMFGTRTEQDKSSTKQTKAFAHEIVRNERSNVAISFKVTAKIGCALTLTAFNDEYSCTKSGEICEAALTYTDNNMKITTALKKLGGTPFYPTYIDCDTDETAFINQSELNALKTTVCNQLIDKLSQIKAKPLYTPQIINTSNIKSEQNGAIYRFNSIKQIPQNNFMKEIILPIESSTYIIEEYINQNLIVHLELPRVIFNTAKLEEQLNKTSSLPIKSYVIGNIYSLHMLKKYSLPISFGFGTNIYNSLSLNFAKNMANGFCLISPELNLPATKALAKNNDIAAWVYGYLPVMVTRNCPLKNGNINCNNCNGSGIITDRMGIDFNVTCRNNVSEIYNSCPNYLLDLPDIALFNKHLLYFTTETAEQCEKIIYNYENKLQYTAKFTRGIK